MSAIYFWGIHVATEHQENEKNTAAPSLSTRGAARRRVTKVGLGAAGGVLATLDSKAAMAAMTCKSPSGSLSSGISSHYKASTKCNGLLPSDWRDKDVWPISKDIMFAAVFYARSNGSACPSRQVKQPNGGPYQANSYYCARFSDLLNGQGCDANGIGMQMVAAYLNVVQGNVNVITTETLQSIWNELQSTGRFCPTAGTYWNSAQVANYLATYINR